MAISTFTFADMTTYYCTTIEEALRRVKRAVKVVYPGCYFGGISLRSGRRGGYLSGRESSRAVFGYWEIIAIFRTIKHQGFKERRLKYNLMRNNHFISVIVTLLLSIVQLSAQTVDVTGTVYDETGKPLYLCAIHTSESRSTFSDSLGHYSIPVSENKDVEIHFEYLCYKDVVLLYSLMGRIR